MYGSPLSSQDSTMGLVTPRASARAAASMNSDSGVGDAGEDGEVRDSGGGVVDMIWLPDGLRRARGALRAPRAGARAGVNRWGARPALGEPGLGHGRCSPFPLQISVTATYRSESIPRSASESQKM